MKFIKCIRRLMETLLLGSKEIETISGLLISNHIGLDMENRNKKTKLLKLYIMKELRGHFLKL
jgi:hypothetical protein